MNSFNNNQDYYRKLIVEHYSNPKNKGFKNLPNSLTYHQNNESCVDNFHVEISIKNKVINSARFTGIGCAISTAATDLFCILIEGKTISQIKEIIINYQAMLSEKQFNDKIIENMIAFKNVPRQRNRIKCALIGINGINKIIEKECEKMEMEIKDKISLRTIYLKKLKNVSKNNYQKWNKIIFNKFNESHYFKQNNVFALYNSLPYEVETKEIIELLWKNLKQVCLPRMNGEHLEFYFINSWNDIVFDNDFKIGQPILNCQKVIGSQIDCMLVPLIAFDKDYYRIGYGKGFYDRYLSKNKFNFSKIGLGFAIQKIPYIINHDNWDIPLDYIFTN